MLPKKIICLLFVLACLSVNASDHSQALSVQNNNENNITTLLNPYLKRVNIGVFAISGTNYPCDQSSNITQKNLSNKKPALIIKQQEDASAASASQIVHQEDNDDINEIIKTNKHFLECNRIAENDYLPLVKIANTPKPDILTRSQIDDPSYQEAFKQSSVKETSGQSFQLVEYACVSTTQEDAVASSSLSSLNFTGNSSWDKNKPWPPTGYPDTSQ